MVFCFSFTATYFPKWGYFIDAINGVSGNWEQNRTYWQISNSSGPLDLGIHTIILVFPIFIYITELTRLHTVNGLPLLTTLSKQTDFKTCSPITSHMFRITNANVISSGSYRHLAVKINCVSISRLVLLSDVRNYTWCGLFWSIGSTVTQTNRDRMMQLVQNCIKLDRGSINKRIL